VSGFEVVVVGAVSLHLNRFSRANMTQYVCIFFAFRPFSVTVVDRGLKEKAFSAPTAFCSISTSAQGWMYM